MARVFNNLKFIDLFAGIGGFHIALSKYNASCVFASEKDKYAIETYKYNHLHTDKERGLLHGDITKINSDDIPAYDILCAGFPCQPFSISGNQLGFDDARGTMFFEVIRLIRGIERGQRPSIIFLENVSNLKRHDEGQTLDRMRLELEGLGYTVFYDVLNASNFGVPQSRKRIYFVAFHERFGEITFNFPSPEIKETHLRDVLENDVDESYNIVRNDIVFKTDEEIHKLEVKKKNQPIRIGTINKGGQGDRIYSIEGHAITLSAEGGGAGAKTGAYLVNGTVRKLTTRECLRVQGYPEDFKFPDVVTQNQRYKQLGNTVAIPVLESILGSICELDELHNITIEENNI